MITAAEALKLPSAQLSAEERAAADKLEGEIEEHVRKFMERYGCEFQTEEMNKNVLGEVRYRLICAGYIPQWNPRVEQHRLNNNRQVLVGWQLSLNPNLDAYKTADAVVLSSVAAE